MVMIVAMFAFMIIVSSAMTQIPATVGSANAGDVFVLSVVPTTAIMGTAIITPYEALSTPAEVLVEATIPETCRPYATRDNAIVSSISEIVRTITIYRDVETINTELMANSAVVTGQVKGLIGALTVRGVTTELMTKPANRASPPDAIVNYSPIENYSSAANYCHFIS